MHGLKRNRHIVETFVRYAHEQNYIKNPLDIDKLFAPVTNDRSLPRRHPERSRGTAAIVHAR